MAVGWTLKLKDDVSGGAGKAATAMGRVTAAMLKTKGSADQAETSLARVSTAIDKLNKSGRSSSGKGAGGSFDVGAEKAKRYGSTLQRTAQALEHNRTSTVAVDKATKGLGRSLNAGVPKISAFGKSVQFMGRHFGPKGARGMMAVGEALSKYGGHVQRAAGALGTLGGVAGSVLATLGAMGAGVMAAGAAIGAQVAIHVRGLQAFRESTLFAFTKILGTANEAKRVFDIASKTSFDIGADLQGSVGAMNTLLAKGFKADFADQLIRRMADLSTLNPKANVEALIYNIGKIRAQGRLQGDELQALSEAGLNVADVYAEIAKAMKLTQKPGQSLEEQILALQSAGKIKSAVAIPAIMEAIKKASGGGAAGSVASEKASKSPEGMLMRLLNLKDQLLSSVKIDWSPITRGVERLMAAMQSPAGTRFIESIGNGIGLVLGKLNKISQADFEAMFDKGAEAVEMFSGAMGSLLNLIIEMGPAWSVMADSGILVLEGLWIVIENIRGAVAFLQATAMLVGAAWDAISGAASSLGGDIVAGIVAGIEGGASSVVDAIVGVATGAIAAAEEVLGIASPSKVFERIYKQTGAGAVRGAEKSAPQVAAATSDMGVQAAQSGRQAATNIRSSTSNNNSRSISVGAVHMHGAGGGAGENARALRSELRAMQMTHG